MRCGSRYGGYTLLAEVVARVSHQSVSKFTAERVFKPPGMDHTHFHIDHQEVASNRAYSYHDSLTGGFENSPLNYANAGSTSLFTTAEDLGRRLRNFETQKVGGPEVLA